MTNSVLQLNKNTKSKKIKKNTDLPGYGREISSVILEDETRLIIEFNGSKIAIFDGGQQCCERRYMRTDDDIQSLVGHTLLRIEAKQGPRIENDDDTVHEICFLEIGTDDGFISFSNHNENNGYYGGFNLKITADFEINL
jgi:hypothetical protein